MKRKRVPTREPLAVRRAVRENRLSPKKNLRPAVPRAAPANPKKNLQPAVPHAVQVNPKKSLQPAVLRAARAESNPFGDESGR